MNFSSKKNASHTIIKVYNENLDAFIAPELKSEMVVIVADGEKNIFVDLSNCISCDSSGMSALLLGNRLCHGVNGNFVLYGLSPGINQMKDLAGFDTILKVADTLEAAEEVLQR